MENHQGAKCTYDKCIDSGTDSDKSVQSYINLGNVEHTVEEYSSSDSNCSDPKSPRRKKMKINTHARSSQESQDDSNDCKVIGYKSPPKDVSLQEINELESLYPNQLQDHKIAKLYDQQFESDTDDHDNDESSHKNHPNPNTGN